MFVKDVLWAKFFFFVKSFFLVFVLVQFFGASFRSTSSYAYAQKPEKTVTIIGSGVAGLSSAYFLTPDYQVEVLEIGHRTGGNHQSCNVDGKHSLNLGASYVPGDDSYSQKIFEEFNIPLTPLPMNEAKADFDHVQSSRVSIGYLPYFLPIYASIRALNWFLPYLENEVTLSSVLEKLPANMRRKALFSISYDPFVKGDLENVLFIPYMNYLLWVSSSGFQAPWGTLTNESLYPHLKSHDEFSLTTGASNIKVTKYDSKFQIEAYDLKGDSIKLIYSDYVIYSGYPQEAANLFEDLISPELAQALKKAFFRKGRSIVVKIPPEFKEKSLYFMSRIHDSKEVNAMIDTQGSSTHARIFFMDNCQREDLLGALNLTEESIVDESDEFVHYAPDHVSIYSDLQEALRKELPDLNSKGIYFSSYSFHPSGFRNADQSISMSTDTARKIFDRDKYPYPARLSRFLAVEKDLSFFQKFKRSFLKNQPY